MDNAIQVPANAMSAARRRMTCEDRRRLSGSGGATGPSSHRKDRARAFIVPVVQSGAFFGMVSGDNSKALDASACVRWAVDPHSRLN